MEAQWALDEGEATPATLDQYQKMSNTIRRLIESAGLKSRKAKTVPDLKAYLSGRGNGHDRQRRPATIDHDEEGD
jgi:hypothetical protein